MRTSFVIALVVSSLASTAVVASAQSATATVSARQQIGRQKHNTLLRNIKLTVTEKASVKAVHGKYLAESMQLRNSMRPAMQEARLARQKGDSAGARAAMERTRGTRTQLMALRNRENGEVRASLSPEHQAQFDTNAQLAAKHQGRRGRGQSGTQNPATNG
jgi:Spy/CpxP family protein refolding chaperone